MLWGLAELVRKGKIGAAELCEEAIRRIEQVNPQLNAVVTPMYVIGRKAARGAMTLGPFAGVPFLLKDLVCAFAGVPMRSGSKAYRNFIPDYDNEMVVRYKQAGLIILGNTNTSEFGLMGVTDPEAFGPCRNPWNPALTPGGSSGGSAAPVAAGIVPMRARATAAAASGFRPSTADCSVSNHRGAGIQPAPTMVRYRREQSRSM